MPESSPTTYDLSPYAPTTPERTAELAEAASATVRALAHTTAREGAYATPADLYSVLGLLQAAVAGLPQVLGQSSTWIKNQAKEGRVRHDGDADSITATAQLVGHLQQAKHDADALERSLSAAQRAAAFLGAGDPPARTAALLLRAAWAQRDDAPTHTLLATQIDQHHTRQRPGATLSDPCPGYDVVLDGVGTIGTMLPDPGVTLRREWIATAADGTWLASRCTRDEAVAAMCLAAGIDVDSA